MRILLVSDSPHIQSAYTIQAWRLAKLLQKAGHEVVYYGMTLHGHKFTFDGIEVLGNTAEDFYGNGLLSAHVSAVDPDFVLIYKDPHVFEPHILKTLPAPVVMMAPVDTEPAHEALLARLPYAYKVLTMSQNGKQLLEQAGVKATYCPITVDTDLFCPRDRLEARNNLDLPADAFVALFIGANHSYPSRKNLDAMLYAWAMFMEVSIAAEQHQDAILVLHTRRNGQGYGGIDLDLLRRKLGIRAANIRFTDHYQYMTGVEHGKIADLYAACDVYLALSAGEGANAPLLEAAASGRQAIATEFTAHRDHLLSGFQIPSAPGRGENGDVLFDAGGELYWHDLGGFRFRPFTKNIVMALRSMATMPDDKKSEREAVARQRALDFAIETVFARYWLPLLTEIELELNGSLNQREPL